MEIRQAAEINMQPSRCSKSNRMARQRRFSIAWSTLTFDVEAAGKRGQLLSFFSQTLCCSICLFGHRRVVLRQLVHFMGSLINLLDRTRLGDCALRNHVNLRSDLNNFGHALSEARCRCIRPTSRLQPPARSNWQSRCGCCWRPQRYAEPTRALRSRPLQSPCQSHRHLRPGSSLESELYCSCSHGGSGNKRADLVHGGHCLLDMGCLVCVARR